MTLKLGPGSSASREASLPNLECVELEAKRHSGMRNDDPGRMHLSLRA